MLINGEQNIFKNLGDFFSPYMRFLQYAVFPRKLKTHKPRTKCTAVHEERDSIVINVAEI